MHPRPLPGVLSAAFALLAAVAVAGDQPADPLAGCTVRRDVTYTTTPNGPLTLDVYRPPSAQRPSPVLLFLHGGGWVAGSKHDALPEVYEAPSYADRTWPSMLPYLRRGLAVVSVAYRLAGVAPAPAAVDDCRQALEWVGTHGAEHGLDSRRIVTIGASAGGHLALMTAFAAKSDDGVRGAIDLYGITDVPPLLATPDQRPWATEWIGKKGADAEAMARRMSPLSLVRAGLPPVLIVHSDADAVVPYDQAERLARALRAADVDVELVALPGAVHGFLTPAEHARLERSVLAFLRRVGLLAAGVPAPGERSSEQEPDGHRQQDR